MRQSAQWYGLALLTVVLACIGVALIFSGFGSMSSTAAPPTVTPKRGLSEILKVSPIGTEPPTRVPVIVQTATAAPVRSAPVGVGPGGFVCQNGVACVKGNINSKGDKIYHLPSCPSYEQTQIDKAGEQLFVSEAEAIAAGWSRSGNCN